MKLHYLSTLFTVIYETHTNTKIENMTIALAKTITIKKYFDIDNKSSSSDDKYDNKDKNNSPNKEKNSSSNNICNKTATQVTIKTQTLSK